VRIAGSHAQQDDSKHLSRRATVRCTFSDGKVVQTQYSRPRGKGRKIFIGAVPYGEVWRAGDKEAPTFSTDTDLTVGGQDVPAGSYTLFTIPGAFKWTLIISKTAEPTAPYAQGKDLLRTDMRTSKTPTPIENFTIAYDPKDGSCTLRLSWENTQAWVDIAEKKLCWPTTTPLTYQCPDQ